MTATVEAERTDRAAARHLIRSGAPAGDWEPNVSAPAVAVDRRTGEPVLVAARYGGDMAQLRRAFMAYPMSTTKRSTGIRNRSAVFGNVSRKVHMKREGCRACNGAHEAPGPHAQILHAAQVIQDGLSSIMVDQMDADNRAARAAIRGDWLMGSTPWTSGVLNETSPLPYHIDRNNLPVWSAMIVCRRNVTGGHLHLPEYNLTVECRDGDIVWFPGWDLVHGVTPMRRTRPDGYRFTAVFYTVAGMAGCIDPADETRRAQQARTAREDAMLTRQAEEGLLG